MNRFMGRQRDFVGMIVFVVCFLLMPLRLGMAEDYPCWPDPKKGEPYPTIEDLTDGKVKVGDVIDAQNVELLGDLVSPGVVAMVKDGMKMDIHENQTPGEFVPDWWRESTQKSYDSVGKPVIVAKGSTIMTKDGQYWPGGLPYPQPENVDEIIANMKYGEFRDDVMVAAYMHFVTKEGKIHKTQCVAARIQNLKAREKVEPLPEYPGVGKEYIRFLDRVHTPRELAGTGMLTLRFWDDFTDPDQGYMYLSAFKRCIRVSATSWQDNLFGSDGIWGDLEGFREPFANWSFKLIGRFDKLQSHPLPKQRMVQPEGTFMHDIDRADWPYNWEKHTVGRKFFWDPWSIAPCYIIEGIPDIEHVYSKKVMYTYPPDRWIPWSMVSYMDNYDRAGTLWKCCVGSKVACRSEYGTRYGEPFMMECSQNYYDIQSKHQTNFFGNMTNFNLGLLDPTKLNLKALIKGGK